MSIFWLAVIGYFSGLVGSILGGIFNLYRLRADRSSGHAGGSAQVIFFIMLYMIFTSKPLQAVKVLMAVVLAGVLQRSSHPAQWIAGICAAAACSFMALLPALRMLWQRLFQRN